VLGLTLRFQGDLDRLREASETVVALNPNHALGVAGLGIYRVLDGRPQEALPYFERAFRLSPRDPQRAIWHLWVGLAHVMLGDDLKALDESKRSAAANPQYSPAFALQVSALALLGREAEARAALAVLQQLQPDVTITRNKEDRGYHVASPEFHRLIERYLDGLRKTGLPE
jgi:tetratricopeptide (TPR) repeat protein